MSKSEDIEKEVGKIVGFDIKMLKKEWRSKVVEGKRFSDDDLLHISTGSIKLDWALRRPFLEGQFVEIFGPAAVGKAQPLWSKILTPKGFIEMGKLNMGDEICTPDGLIAKIAGIYPQGKLDIYRITFSDNSSTVCCGGHLWYTQSYAERYYRKEKTGSIRTTNEIKDSIFVKNTMRKNYKIPLTKPVKMISQEIPLPAYFMGIMLGDGYIPENANPRISSMDKQIVDRASSVGFNLKKVPGDNCDYRFSGMVNGIYLKDYFKELGLGGKKSYEKFIPNCYKINSIDIRLETLRGLMDTDGTICTRSGHTSYTSTSYQLAEDVRFLVQSLGGTANIKSRITSYPYKGIKKKGRKSYRISITMPRDIIPFNLDRKIIKWNKDHRGPARLIKSIEYIGKEETQCIYINDSKHLYITDDFLVTHNTTLALEVCSNAMKLGKLAFYIDLEYKLREAQLEMIDGFNRDNFTILYPDTGEEAMNMMYELMMSYPGCVIVLDSVGGLLPEVEDAENFEKQSMGLVARLCHKMIRKLTGINARNKCVTIFLNHLTATMAMFGKPTTTHGGKAIRNRSAQRIELTALAAGRIKNSTGDIIGQNVRAKVVKNNVFRPNITVEFPIIYGKGIDSELDIFEFARDLGVFETKAKGWYVISIDGEEKNVREVKIRELFKNDDEFKKETMDKIEELFV